MRPACVQGDRTIAYLSKMPIRLSPNYTIGWRYMVAGWLHAFLPLGTPYSPSWVGPSRSPIRPSTVWNAAIGVPRRLNRKTYSLRYALWRSETSG